MSTSAAPSVPVGDAGPRPEDNGSCDSNETGGGHYLPEPYQKVPTSHPIDVVHSRRRAGHDVPVWLQHRNRVEIWWQGVDTQAAQQNRQEFARRMVPQLLCDGQLSECVLPGCSDSGLARKTNRSDAWMARRI